MLAEFPELFLKGLGQANFKASLTIDPTVPAEFYRHRRVLLAMKEAVDAELDRQVASGVLKPVKTSKWAAPLVTVRKADGKSIRLCGSYDLTVNKAAHVDQYPLPRVEDLLCRMAGGKMFTKIDLKDAYLQVPLDEESQQYTVVNTPRFICSNTTGVRNCVSAGDFPETHGTDSW